MRHFKLFPNIVHWAACKEVTWDFRKLSTMLISIIVDVELCNGILSVYSSAKQMSLALHHRCKNSGRQNCQESKEIRSLLPKIQFGTITKKMYFCTEKLHCSHFLKTAKLTYLFKRNFSSIYWINHYTWKIAQKKRFYFNSWQKMTSTQFSCTKIHFFCNLFESYFFKFQTYSSSQNCQMRLFEWFSNVYHLP